MTHLPVETSRAANKAKEELFFDNQPIQATEQQASLSAPLFYCVCGKSYTKMKSVYRHAKIAGCQI